MNSTLSEKTYLDSDIGKTGICELLHQVLCVIDFVMKSGYLQPKAQKRSDFYCCNRLQHLIHDTKDTDIRCLSSI
jgi:hypothetical protein